MLFTYSCISIKQSPTFIKSIVSYWSLKYDLLATDWGIGQLNFSEPLNESVSYAIKWNKSRYQIYKINSY